MQLQIRLIFSRSLNGTCLRVCVKPPFLRLASWMFVVVTQMKPLRPSMIDIPFGKLTKWTFCRLINGGLTWIKQPWPNFYEYQIKLEINLLMQSLYEFFYFSVVEISRVQCERAIRMDVLHFGMLKSKKKLFEIFKLEINVMEFKKKRYWNQIVLYKVMSHHSLVLLWPSSLQTHEIRFLK